MPLWARGRDRARAQLTRECDTATMGAPRQGTNSATRVRGPLDGGAHTVFATAAKRPAPARGRCLPSPAFESGAVHSRGATDCAPMLWSGPRPRPIARRAHCGRAGHPPKVSGRPHWVRRPQPPPPTQASLWMSTADGTAVGTLWTTRGEPAAARDRGVGLRVWLAGALSGTCKPPPDACSCPVGGVGPCFGRVCRWCRGGLSLWYGRCAHGLGCYIRYICLFRWHCCICCTFVGRQGVDV